MDYIRGRIFNAPILPNMSSNERTEIYNSMNEVLQKIHSVDVNKAGLNDYGKQGRKRRQYVFFLFVFMEQARCSADFFL